MSTDDSDGYRYIVNKALIVGLNIVNKGFCGAVHLLGLCD